VDDAIAALATYEEELETICLRLQRPKMHLHAPAQDAASATASAGAGLHYADGIVAAGTPLGSASFVQQYLTTLFDTYLEHVQRVLRAAAAGRRHHAQALYKLVRLCLTPAKVNYLLRTCPTADIEHHARRYDAAAFRATMTVLGVAPDDTSIDPNTQRGASTMARACLPASSGGLGTTSAAATAAEARLGNLLLTAPIIGNALGLGAGLFDPIADGKTALPELYQLLASPRITNLNLEALKGKPPESFFCLGLAKAARTVSHALRPQQLKAVLANLSQDDAAWVLSCGAEGASYLLAPSRLTSAEFSAISRTRVGIAPTADTRVRGVCSHCDGKPIEPSGLHALHCQQPGSEGAIGQRTTRHAIVLDTMRVAFRAAAAACGAAAANRVPRGEPCMADYFPPNPSFAPTDARKPKELRADMSVRDGDNTTTLLDLVITHPSPLTNKHHSDASAIPGIAAKEAFKSKRTKYESRFNMDASETGFLPFAIETGGRWHPEARSFAANFITTCIGKDPKDYDAIDKTLYAWTLRRLLDSIDVARAKAVAHALILVGSRGNSQAR